MNRKLRKLLNDPSAFARDAVKNRVEDLRRLLPTPPPGRPDRRYSVVAAVYGVESYLDDFIGSLVRQTIGFERHVELILVDDGSPDRSAEVIASWQRRYPRSIRYLRKENGGQASARNLGLEHATGDWVTFIDPDDFVDATYFERVDALLAREEARDVAMVCCNMMFYDEATKQIRDTHPLRNRFAQGDRIVRWDSTCTEIQLSASTAFFRRDVIRCAALQFDERIRPTFEDGHFTGRFLLAAGEPMVGVAGSAKYFYRKRADESSTLDRAWTRPSLFDEVLEHGCLDLFRRAEALSDGSVPVWLQRAVFYHLVWYFKRLVNNPEAIAFLDDEQRARFRHHLRALLARIDVETILSFELAGAWLYHKVGILGLLKHTAPTFQHVYVRDYDAAKGLVQLGYFYHGAADLEVFENDGREIFPVFAKTRVHELLGEEFVRERIVWLSVRGLTGKLRARAGDRVTRIVSRGKFFHDGISIRELTRSHPACDPAALPMKVRVEYELSRSAPAAAAYRDAFLFMDRDTQADDNAEHLYRYVRATRPDINAFFVLRRTSHDWPRLEREGFRLLAFGSVQHRLALLQATHVISSHADRYVLAHPGGKELSRLVQAKFTFLQHGVTKDDLSGWLNTKRIDCLVTASPAEHKSIVASGTAYKFTEREVVLTGFPRHDALGSSSAAPERVLAIMPTWRSSLVGDAKGAGNDRHFTPELYDSQYARAWKALLHSPELRALAEEHGYRVQFFPHANVLPYLDWFAPPAPIQTISHAAGSIQDVFRSASILLTDYSSVAFELAYLRRGVLYYQFDREFVFGGGHLTRPGYFDYVRDGFGPVCQTQESLLAALESVMRSGGTPAPEHLARMERTFAFRDGRSCARTLEAILDLDRPTHPSARSAELLVEAARSATRTRSWAYAERRWQLVLRGSPEVRPHDAEIRLAEAKRELGKVDEAATLLRELDRNAELEREIAIERAALATAAEDWPRALELWAAEVRRADDERARARAIVRVAEARRRLGDLAGATRALSELPDAGQSRSALVERAEISSAEQRWADAAERWSALAELPRGPEQSLLRLAEALAKLGRRDEALESADACLRAGSRYERQARALRLRLLEAVHEGPQGPQVAGSDGGIVLPLLSTGILARSG